MLMLFDLTNANSVSRVLKVMAQTVGTSNGGLTAIEYLQHLLPFSIIRNHLLYKLVCLL